MINNLDEAIQHCHENAEELRTNSLARIVNGDSKEEREAFLECAKEYDQLAKLLTELQKRREADKPCEWVEKQFEYEDETSEETRTDTILVCPKCGKQKQPFGRVNFCYWCGARFVKESEREKTMAEDLHDFLMND